MKNKIGSIKNSNLGNKNLDDNVMHRNENVKFL